MWTFRATNGMMRTLKVKGVHIPTAPHCLVSTTRVLQKYPTESFHIGVNSMTLSGDDDNPPVAIRICPTDLLPCGYTVPDPHDEKNRGMANVASQDEVGNNKMHPRSPNLLVASNINLTEPERELLRWHYKLAHVSLRRVQWMFRQGLLTANERSRRLQQAASKLTTLPLCTACQCAKQRRKTNPGVLK